MRKKLFLTLALIMALAITLTACAPQAPPPVPAEAETNNGQQTTDPSEPSSANGQQAADPSEPPSANRQQAANPSEPPSAEIAQNGTAVPAQAFDVLPLAMRYVDDWPAWEYYVLTISGTGRYDGDWDYDLDRLGQDGWLLVGFSHFQGVVPVSFFVRPIQ